VNEAKLVALVSPGETVPPTTTPASAPPPADLAKADQKLADLLGGKS
jgi:hypothetical protein